MSLLKESEVVFFYCNLLKLDAAICILFPIPYSDLFSNMFP